MNITYPEKFKAHVRDMFPNDTFISKALDENSFIVGRILNDSMGSIEPKEILDYIEHDKIDELKRRAQMYSDIADLYVEWSRIIKNEERFAAKR